MKSMCSRPANSRAWCPAARYWKRPPCCPAFPLTLPLCCLSEDMIRKPIPTFSTEEEEANWWDQHSDEHDEWMLDAIRAGETTTLEAVLERARERSED